MVFIKSKVARITVSLLPLLTIGVMAAATPPPAEPGRVPPPDRLVTPNGDPLIEYLGSCLWTGINDVVTDGDYAYCAFISGMMIVDISDLSQPLMVASVFAAGQGQSVFKQDSIVYLADGSGGLLMIGVSDPTQPAIVGVYESLGSAGDIFVEDSLAFVIESSVGMHIINITNPSAPVWLGTYTSPAPVTAITVRDQLAYMSGDAWIVGGDYALQIVSVANPAAPVLIGNYGSPFDYALDICLQDTLAFLADFYQGLNIINISVPSDPSQVGQSEGYMPCQSVAVHGDMAYVGCYMSGGLRIFNVADPATPTPVSLYDTLAAVTGIGITDSIVFFCRRWEDPDDYQGGGLRIINVANPSAPTEIGRCETPPDEPNRIFADNGIAYVAHGRGGLQIVNFADPTRPSRIGSFSTSGPASDVFVRGNLAYVTDGDLQIINVSNPSSPASVGSYTAVDYVQGICIRDSLAYLACGYDGLHIVNIRDSSLPAGLGTCNTPDIAKGVTVQDSLAYVSDYRSALQIINVSDPSLPVLLGDDTSGMSHDIFVRDSLAFIGHGVISNGGLLIYNVSNPALPVLAGSYDTYGSTYGVHVQDSIAYLADRKYDLQVVNVSVPNHPSLLAEFSTPGPSSEIFVWHNRVLLADEYSLIILGSSFHQECCTQRGDVDGEGSIDVGDLTYLVNFLFQGGSPPPCVHNGDVDGSEATDVGDLTYLVAYLFQGGPAPPQCP
ncbi:MAG: hypothetical protein ABII79_12445 [bacterium]